MGKKYIQINHDKQDKSFAIKKAHNQKVIQIKRAHKITQTLSFRANKIAMQELSTNGYMLYMYLVMHPHNRVWALSSKAIYSETTLTEKPYLGAVKELIAKGFLVPHDIESPYGNWKIKDNAYYFYEDRNRIGTSI